MSKVSEARMRLATLIRDKALDYVREHGTDELVSNIPVRTAQLKTLHITSSVISGRLHILDIWEGPKVFSVRWEGDSGALDITSFRPGPWQWNFTEPNGEPPDQRYRAAERMLVEFAKTYQRPALSDAEGFEWGATQDDATLQSFGFKSRVEFDAYKATAIALARTEQTNFSVH